jgi:DNA-binding MurR/RpiR family transcriptional regulator
MDVVTTINALFSSLTKSEQKLGQYILNNTSEITDLSIGELSSRSAVAESTVIRFCRKIGYKGYQELKISLAKNIATQKVHSSNFEINNQDNAMQPYYNYLVAMSSMLDKGKIDEASKMIHHANKICLFGAGLSGIVAEYLQTSLIRLGKTVEFDRDVHLQAINAAVLNDGDLVIAISQSGKTKDILKSIKIAKQHDLKILSITNFLNANITKVSDLSLVAPNMMEENLEFLPMIGQFILIDQICEKIRSKNPEEAKKLKAMISDALINKI